MKLKNILIISFFTISLINAQSKQDLKDILTKYNLSGIITKNNRLFFSNPQDCKSYGCQACALQSSGDFEGWYECQGLGLKRNDYQGHEFAKETRLTAEKIKEQSIKTGKEFISKVQETGRKIRDWVSAKYQEFKSKEENKK